MDPELEEFRKEAIKMLKSEGGFIRNTAQDVLNLPVKAVYIVGSVLDKNQFNENSDIDVAVVVKGPLAKSGINEQLSEQLQHEMLRWPLGDFGVVNTLVFVNELDLIRGRSLKISVQP